MEVVWYWTLRSCWAEHLGKLLHSRLSLSKNKFLIADLLQLLSYHEHFLVLLTKLIICGCCNQLPKLTDLKPEKLILLQFKRPEVWKQLSASLLLSRRDYIPGIFHHWWLPGFVACGHSTPAFASFKCFLLWASVWAPLSLIKIRATASRAHLCNPGCARLKILNLITKTLSNKFWF